MPNVARSRTIAAEPDEVWELVSDPYHLPRWWPGVERVEEVTQHAWTNVMRTPKGKTVRADFSRVSADPPERLVWRQELAESPFERIMSEAVTELSLESSAGGGTVVDLRTRIRLRGLSRLGFLQIGRAAAAKLQEALDGLEQALGRERPR